MPLPAPNALPKVDLPLVGLDGNAFSILGRFRRAARKAGWTAPQIDALLEEAMSGDYDNLLQTVVRHCR